MSDSSRETITSLARAFLEPTNATHRQYEALRAYFVDGYSIEEVADRFGYTPGSFRVMCTKFRKNPDREFFLPTRRGPGKAPKKDRLTERVVELRKRNLSIYDIRRELAEEGKKIAPSSVHEILKKEGFARLPRRGDDERPGVVKPTAGDAADVGKLDLAPCRLRTQAGGLFLFLPMIASLPFDEIMDDAGLPGSVMVPAGCAMRSLLALKLWGVARTSHVMSHVLDEGLALFSGLNVIPKRSFLTEYSCRVDPRCYPKLNRLWFDAAGTLGLERGVSFDLDFHTIPFHGHDALVEKHYISKRSRMQKGILAFLAQDSETRVFCYANGSLRAEERAEEIIRFAHFWKERTGKLPEELIFDSKLTTYPNLDKLNKMGISFTTLRRRSAKMMREIREKPPSAWRRIELKGVARKYRNPRILDEKITLKGYKGPIRQLTIVDLGHEEPTLLLTNQMRRSPSKLVTRYAQRMVIENQIADGIDFFHMDALSSAVPMKVDMDLQLTLMASSLYRLLGERVGNGYERAKSRHIFRDLVDATARVTITEDEVRVRFHKRAHNPLLIAAGFADTDVPVPWLGGKTLRLLFG
jgi:transposase